MKFPKGLEQIKKDNFGDNNENIKLLTLVSERKATISFHGYYPIIKPESNK